MIKSGLEMVEQAKENVRCITAQEAQSLYAENPNAVILDVRECDAADKACIEKSLNIPRGMLEMQLGKHCADPEQMLLVHCAGGNRAVLAAATLQEMGYRNVYAITATFPEIQEILVP